MRKTSFDVPLCHRSSNFLKNIKKAKLIDEKLKLEIVQMEGRKEVPFKEFLNGYQKLL